MEREIAEDDEAIRAALRSNILSWNMVQREQVDNSLRAGIQREARLHKERLDDIKEGMRKNLDPEDPTSLRSKIDRDTKLAIENIKTAEVQFLEALGLDDEDLDPTTLMSLRSSIDQQTKIKIMMIEAQRSKHLEDVIQSYLKQEFEMTQIVAHIKRREELARSVLVRLDQQRRWIESLERSESPGPCLVNHLRRLEQRLADSGDVSDEDVCPICFTAAVSHEVNCPARHPFCDICAEIVQLQGRCALCRGDVTAFNQRQ